MLTQMEQHLQAIVTVLSLVNPLICGVMFAQIEAGQSRAIRITDATKAALAVLVILLVAALAGARVLQIFGVSLDAFSIAGGGVLTWIGFSMLRGNSPQARDPSKDGAAEKRSLTPLILFAKPGHDYRSHHARCCACEAGAAGHCTRRGRGSRGCNVGRYAACGSRRVSRKWRGQPAARHGDAVYGIDRPRYGRAVRADRLPQFFQLRT
jgi:MarC family integral membrane protein